MLNLRGIMMRSNLTDEAQGIRRVAAFLVHTDELECRLSVRVRLLQTAGQQQGFTQRGGNKRMMSPVG